jgi:diguanylate cyclase (GGDEF)-like protein
MITIARMMRSRHLLPGAAALLGGLALLLAGTLHPPAPGAALLATEGKRAVLLVAPAADAFARQAGDPVGGGAAAARLGTALDRLAAAAPPASAAEALAAAGRALLAGGLGLRELGGAVAALQPLVDQALHEMLLAEAAGLQARERAAERSRMLVLPGVFLLGVALAALLAGLLRRPNRVQPARDPLTGTLTRQGFAELAERRLGRAPRSAVLAIGVERLRELNEALGRSAGDALLRAAATRLGTAIRDGDLLARLGGDRFGVLLAGADEASVEATIARLRAAVAQPVPHGEGELPLGLRFGVATTSAGAEAGADFADGLLRDAEAALAGAAAGGRGGVALFTPADRAQAERERLLLRALGEPGSSPAGLVAFLQPQVRLHDGSLAGFEALMRWPHPTLGTLMPGEVMPVAERFGRMPQLGRGVRRSAFSTFAMLRRAGLIPNRGPYVAINISAAELTQPRFVQELTSDLVGAGLEPAALELEITEDVLLDQVPERAREALAALRREGVRLALDDFGTGYAGFGQLLRLPLDTLKLDRRFVRGLGVDPRSEAIIVSMLGLARGLGFEVVAEGIETEAQRQHLAELGCSTGQGFGIGRPLGTEDLAVWLVGHRAQRAVAEDSEKIVALRRRGS